MLWYYMEQIFSAIIVILILLINTRQVSDDGPI